MTSSPNALLKQLPSVDEVLNHPALEQALKELPREIVCARAREAVNRVRQGMLEGSVQAPNLDQIAFDAARAAARMQTPSLRRVINATGIIAHTNLGRSPLAAQAIDAVNGVMRGYSTLEYDLATMQRGSRHAHCEQLLCELTGAEAALAVNNNAAAVLLVLTEFAAGREAIVSRGELVEIGGSFRIPDIMLASGARMVEVGTTNKTHERDYERALTADTALLLKVHPSNYRMLGFTEAVGIGRLRALADAAPARPLVYEDQGSGTLLELQAFGDDAEPAVSASLDAGADLVSFSGDKLLGGPQAGIIAGKRTLIDRLKANPLARALRLDKMTLAALEATLRLYLQPDRARADIPTVRMLTEGAQAVRERAAWLQCELTTRVTPAYATFAVVPTVARAGGGALPLGDIPSFALQVSFAHGSAHACSNYLGHNCPVPIVARISHEELLCDARTLLDSDELHRVAAGIASYFEQLG